MSLELGCRERLLQSEDGRQAVALLDVWEQRIVELEVQASGFSEVDGIVKELELDETKASLLSSRLETEQLKDDLDFESACLNAAQKNGKCIWEQWQETRAELATTKAALEEAKLAVSALLKASGVEGDRHEETRAHLSRTMQGELVALAEISRLNVELAIAQGSSKEALQNLDDSEAELTQVKEQLKSWWRRSDKNRRYASLWKEHAKRLAVTVRELEREGEVAAELLEQREDAYRLLWKSYEREQKTHDVYKETAEHFVKAMQANHDRAQPLLKACQGVPECVRKEALGLSIPWLATLFEAINVWMDAEAKANQFG